MFLIKLLFFSFASLSDYLNFDGILIGDNHFVRRMNHFNATNVSPQTGQKLGPNVCENLKSKLPSIRELAALAQSRGAQGVLEIDQIGTGPVPDGFYKINSIDTNGKHDSFYYSHKGYRAPNNVFAQYWYWSSSIVDSNTYNAFFLVGIDGSLGAYNRTYGNDAVVCITW